MAEPMSNAALVIPDTDVLGQPTAPSEFIRSHWAVLIHSPVRGIPGPHLLESQDESSARIRLKCWERDCPDSKPRPVRRKIVETCGEWEEAR